ncbi:MAG: AAA family ATPase [Clostridia bacterium]|nr:AAA family ATPase [Clostridia bacterium]
MQLSYSRVQTFAKCPYQFKLRYIDKYTTLPENDPQDALILGHALHTGIEKDTEAAINEYYNAYPVIDDNHITEAIKLEYWLPKIKEEFYKRYGSDYDFALHETKIENESFIGFIDLLVPVDWEPDGDVVDEYYDLYDFKYSNNVQNYMESEQLHLYKYYFEELNPHKHIRDMYFMFVPKCQLKLKYKNKTNPIDETLFEFRKRIIEDLDNKKIEFVKIDYKDDKVFDFYTDVRQLQECTDYIKKPSRLCDWCEYQRYCESEGKDDLDMVLPKNERTSNSSVTRRKIWIYGSPFSGKTYLANQFPDMLLLSTDGNYTQLPDGIPPHIDIKDVVTVEGRITKKQFAWEVFKEAISELEKKQNDFKTIVADLIEDTYEQCRLYMYDKLGITHESDDSFRAWDKVRTEYLSTIKRLMNLDYENIILISHEDTSKDITKKSGDKITSIKPNLQDKAALKISGMVDMVIRVINDENKRSISFKTSDVVFGGGRLSVNVDEIPCSYEELIKVYEEANEGKEVVKNTGGEQAKSNERATREVPETTTNDNGANVSTSVERVQEEPVETATSEPAATETPEVKTRTRKPREVVEEAKAEAAEEVPETKTEEAPVRRRRRVSE